MKRNGHGIIALILSLLIALPAQGNIVVNGELQRAQLEKLSSAPTGSEARIYFNTADKKGALHNGTSFDNIVQETIEQTLTNKRLDSPKINEAVDLTATSTELNQLDGVTVGGNSAGDILTTDGVQTLTGKTFDDPVTLQELSTTPATPSAGYKKIYPKDDGVLYTLNDAGEEVPVGTGSGSGGGKNYVLNPDAEINADNVTVTPFVMQVESSSDVVLAGEKSFKITELGSGVGNADWALGTFDLIDIGKLHRVKASVSAESNENVTMGVYNVTDSAYVTPVRSMSSPSVPFLEYFAPQSGKTYVIRLSKDSITDDSVYYVDELSISPDNVSGTATGTGEYLEAVANTITSTTTADTEIDANDLSLTLTPGRWEIGYNVSAQLTNNGVSAGSRNGRVRITDSSNTPVVNSESLIGRTLLEAGAGITFNISKQFVVDVTTETTYKVRITASHGSAEGALHLLPVSVTGTLTNPDNASIFYAKNIGPEVNIANIKQTSPLKAGFISSFGGSSAPLGWLLNDGSAVSRTEYAELFAAIGTTHGVGDGSTTFNLPDDSGATYTKAFDDSIDLTGFASADTDKMGLIQLSDEFVATDTKPGLVSTGTQTFGGIKTFDDGLSFGGSTLNVYSSAEYPDIQSTVGVTGAGTGGGVSIKATRIGNLVTLTWRLTIGSGASNQVFSTAAYLGSEFRPLQATFCVWHVVNTVGMYGFRVRETGLSDWLSYNTSMGNTAWPAGTYRGSCTYIANNY